MSDALTAADQRHVTLIGLLDLSSAFDCVDHYLPLQRLERTFGLSGMVLHWLASYVTSRSHPHTHTVSAVRSFAGVCFRPSALHSVHGRPQSSGGKSWPHPASVYWRLSNLPQHASWWCCGGGQPIFPLSWRRWSLVELKPIATKPSQDTVLWLGSKYKLLKLNIQDVPVLSTSVRIVDSARDLGVVTLSLSFRFRSVGWGVSHTGSPSPLGSALFSTSSRSTRKSSMLYFTTSIHLFLCLPLLRCPRTSASKILLTQSSSSRRCTCPNHLNLASRTLSVMHATPRTRQMSSIFF